MELMKEHICVSLPTAVSGIMRLYIAYILTNTNSDYVLLVGSFFLTLSIYSFDRTEDYGKSLMPAFFT